MDYSQYLRNDKLPYIWCAGCGDRIVLKAILRAIHDLGLEKDEIAMVAGIGCSGRTAGYVDFNTLHTTHGRAITFATGLKMARPDMTVIVVSGDGDATAIGGNHLIHAARRNIDITVLVYNNHIYGMTGGQVSPTTPMGDFATTAPYGSLENTFDISGLTIAAGASFVARSAVADIKYLSNLIGQAISKKGFSLVEVMTPCYIAYGRMNEKGSAAQMILDQREEAVDVEEAKSMSPEDLQDRIVVGVLADRELPEYIATYDRVISQAQQR